MSKLVSASIGDIAVVFSKSAAHKHYTFADLEWMILSDAVTRLATWGRTYEIFGQKMAVESYNSTSTNIGHVRVKKACASPQISALNLAEVQNTEFAVYIS